MTKYKRPRPMSRWDTLASAHFGGDINRLKCTDAERLQFPFRALTAHPTTGKLVPVTVTALLHSDEQLARDFGVYVEVSGLPDIAATGVANIMAVDLVSPNWMPIADAARGEYRHLAGPPPQAPDGTIKTVWIDKTGQSGAMD